MHIRVILAITITQLMAALSALSATTNPANEANAFGITIGPDTTGFIGPLLPDGTVDYVSAVNAVESTGITPDNNAVAVLMRVILEDPITPQSAQRRAAMLHAIGVADKTGDPIVFHYWKGFQHAVPTDDPNNPGYTDRYLDAQIKPWAEEDLPELAAWVRSNKPALAIAEEASKRPHFWLPNVLKPEDSVLFTTGPEPFAWKLISVGFAIRSMMELHRGDMAGALADLLTMQRLGALILQSPQPLLVSVGSSIQDAACRASLCILQNSDASAKELLTWSTTLTAIDQVPSSTRTLWERSRYEFEFTIQHLAKAHIPVVSPDFQTPDWNIILRLGNTYYDDVEKDRSSLTPAQRVTEENAFANKWDRLIQIADTVDMGDQAKWLPQQTGESRTEYSKRVGAILLFETQPSVKRISEDARRSNESVDWLAKVGVPLTIYRKDHREYPATLDALIPKYSTALPQSTSEYPIGYERKDGGYIIRHIRVYSPSQMAQLARYHKDYDLLDVIIRTDDLNN